MNLALSTGPLATLNSVSATNVDETVKFTADKAGTGGGYYISLIGRRTGTSDYRLKVRIMNGAATAYLVQTLNGTETIVATQTIPGLTVQPGDVLNLRLRITGTGTTTLQAKVWAGNAAEPAAWNLTGTDTAASLQGAGVVGLYSYLSGSATNAPVTIRYDDFVVTAATP